MIQRGNLNNYSLGDQILNNIEQTPLIKTGQPLRNTIESSGEKASKKLVMKISTYYFVMAAIHKW